MMTEPVYGYYNNYNSFSLFMSQDEIDYETIWLGEGDESLVYRAVHRAFGRCINLREVSYFFGCQGRTWSTVSADQAARGETPRFQKCTIFVNRKHTYHKKGTGYIKRRFF